MVVVCSHTLPESVNYSMEDDISEGQQKVENEPYFHHFDIGCLGQTLHHRDEHAGENQHHSKVHCQSGLKEEGFEVVGNVSNDVEQHCGGVDSGDDTQQLAPQPDLN